jgi:uncharacterized protein YkwD
VRNARTPLTQRVRHAERLRIALAAGVTALTLVGCAIAVGPGSTDAEVTRDSVPQAGPVVLAPAGGAAVLGSTTRRAGIDTSDREVVLAAWRRLVQPGLGVKTDWTGDLGGCRPGSPSPEATKTILDNLNFVRGLAGLSRVTFSETLSARAQNAALIMSANQTLTHDVPRTFKCYSSTGALAASRSNLYLGWTDMPADFVVPGYMTDPGPSNILAGHRRWILYPSATVFGSGLTSTAQALWVVGPTSNTNPNPRWVPWPTPGWFPSDFQPDGLWSLASGYEHANFARAHVKVMRDGEALRVHMYRFVGRGYGSPAITWHVADATEPGTYTVKVTGIRGAASSAYTYQVRIFHPSTSS